MGKIYMAALAIIMMTGCASNYRNTEITIYSGKNTSIDAEGATNTTDTGQMPQADLTPLVEAAQAAIGGKASSIVDKITDMIGGDDDKSEPEALEDADQGTVEEVE